MFRRILLFIGVVIISVLTYYYVVPTQKQYIVSHYLNVQKKKGFEERLQKIAHDYNKEYFGKEIPILAKEYATEIAAYHPLTRTMHPIDRDKEVAKEYLIIPFKESIANYIVGLSKKINDEMLLQTEKLYDGFFKYCVKEGYDCSFTADELPVQVFPAIDPEISYDNNFKEYGKLGNTIDEGLSWVPFVGDAKEIFDIKVFKDKRNEEEAKEYMERKVSLLNQVLKNDIKMYVDYTFKNIENQLTQFVEEEK
jgi:hypothetical protein